MVSQGLERGGKVLLLEGIHPAAVERLTQAGFQVDLESTALQDEELISRAGEYDAIGIRSKTQLHETVLAKASQLSAIGAFCIGTNQIDLDAANLNGIPVFNAPYSNTRSVAELVICEMIALSRQLGDRNTLAHQGKWLKSAAGSNEVRGKTLGIIGYGHIGSQVSVLAESLGLKVIFFDIVKKLPLGNAQTAESLGEVLEQADFVSLHVPETSSTKSMVNQNFLSSMRKRSYLINASRGTVVDIPALVNELESGHIGGAAVDVFPKEPRNNQESFESALQNMNNVILTPHIGGSTEEAQEAIGNEVAESLVKFLKGGITGGAVNFPQIEVGMPGEARRILNIHKNVPGVLGEVNSIISESGANIRGQHLSTDPNIGYLLIDMEVADAEPVAEKIAKLSTSLKTRMV